MKMTISRPGAPETKLNVEIMSQDKLGENRPVAFILPGGPGADHSAYLKYGCLKNVVDLVFHDPRGCGLSDRGDRSSYTMSNYIDDVESIRQQLGLNHIIVIGKSYGSMCALGYALRYPHVVEKLVLAAGAASYRFLDSAKQNLKRIGTPEQIRIGKKLWAGNFRNIDDLLSFFQLTNSLYSVKARIKPADFDLVKKSKQFSYEVLNEGFKNEFWQFDYENELHKVVCPTLLLSGREDWINDVKQAEFMSARIPHSQLMIFNGASHAMETDVENEFFHRVSEFIAE